MLIASREGIGFKASKFKFLTERPRIKRNLKLENNTYIRNLTIL